jgi:hypothetical protein
MQRTFLILSSALILLLFAGGVVGECIEGNCANGQGTYTLPDGQQYIGEWKDGKTHGQGTYTWPSGQQYIGEWKDGNYHGQATFTYSRGDQYIGEYKDGKKHGQGTYTWPSGQQYIGEWKDDKKNGQGGWTSADGDQYLGEWKDDKKNGQGGWTSADGDQYLGEWKDDKKHGQGTYTYTTGKIEEGFFEDGICKYDCRAGYSKEQPLVEPEQLTNFTNPLFDTYEEVFNLFGNNALKLLSTSEPLIGIICFNQYIDQVPLGVAAVLYGHVTSEGEKVFEGMLTDYGIPRGRRKYTNFEMNGFVQKNPFMSGDETDLIFYDASTILSVLNYYDEEYGKDLSESLQIQWKNENIDDNFWIVDRTNLTITQRSALPGAAFSPGSKPKLRQYNRKCEMVEAKTLYQDMLNAKNKSKAKEKAEQQKRKENVKF